MGRSNSHWTVGKPKDRKQFNRDITRDGQYEAELTLP